MSKLGNTLRSRLVINLLVLPLLVSAAAEEENDFSCSVPVNSATALKYKIIAIFSTLIIGFFGVCLPIFGLDLVEDLLSPSLTSSCLGDEPPWVVSVSAVILTMIESFASSCVIAFENKEEKNKKGDLIHVHNQRQHDHNNIRRKLLTHVLESGIVVYSIIVGIALGASSSVSTIKPFIGAITIHQLLEGFRPRRCISKAKFELKKILFFKRCSCRNIILHGDF
ncbi:hypothetical protein Bca101_090737 [Brassica carinata]